MIAYNGVRGDSGELLKRHVLSEREAFGLLSSSHRYFNAADAYINGRHKTEILAEAMLQAGQESLATDAMYLHTAMTAFQKGAFNEVQFLSEGPVFTGFLKNAQATKFEASVKKLVGQLSSFDEILTDRDVNWETSSTILAEMKRARFPNDLTMVERLDQWQRDQPNGREP